MSRLQKNCLIAAITVLVIFVGMALLQRDKLPPQQHQPVAGNAVHQGFREEAVTPEDLRTILQDVSPLANAFAVPIGIDQEQQLLHQFRQRYFSPWTMSEPRFWIEKVRDRNQQLAARTWYGENRLQVEPARVQQLVDLTDWEHFPSMNQAGVVVKPVSLRILPTIRPLYEAPDDFPFDHLQFAEIKPNEPVRILHRSTDGAWFYIETSTVNGWVDPDAVAFADSSVQQRLTEATQLVVIRDFTSVQTHQGKTVSQPKIGTLYPLVAEETDYWVVDMAVAGADQNATLARGRIAKGDARPHPLLFTADAVSLIGNELLKTPYGWGEVYRNRDCSATTRDFFLAFGIWLPRNSHQQINSGPFVSLTHLSSIEKEQRIREQGVPFRTLLYHPGHIMLYVGLHGNKPLILHTAWGLRYKTAEGPEKKYIIGRTLISTLELGKELPLSKGSLLERLDAMLTFPVVGEAPPEHPQANPGEQSLISR